MRERLRHAQQDAADHGRITLGQRLRRPQARRAALAHRRLHLAQQFLGGGCCRAARLRAAGLHLLQHLAPGAGHRRTHAFGRLLHHREQRVFHLVQVRQRLLQVLLAQVGALGGKLLQRRAVRLHGLQQRVIHATHRLVQQGLRVDARVDILGSAHRGRVGHRFQRGLDVAHRHFASLQRLQRGAADGLPQLRAALCRGGLEHLDQGVLVDHGLGHGGSPASCGFGRCLRHHPT
jgi:hypothetical protein